MILIQNKSDVAILEVSGDIVSNDYKYYKDDYGFDLTTPIEVKDFFKNNPDKEIRININSNGGDVFSGTAIANMIKEHKGKTTAHIESIGASIASVIAMACDEVKMPKNAYLMIHKPWAYMGGNADDFEKTIELLNKIQNNIEEVYMSKVVNGIERKTITKLVNEETWLTGEEASKYFNITLLEELKVLNCTSGIKYDNMPDFLLPKNEVKKVEIPKELKEKIEKLEKM